jgi:hypothetical protein
VNNGTMQTDSFPPAGPFSDGIGGTMTVGMPLVAGSNTIEFSNPTAYAPDIAGIIVAASPG